MTSNSERKRRERQLMQSGEQSQQDKARYQTERQRYIAEREREERNAFLLKFAAWTIGIGLVVWFIWAQISADNERAAANDKLVQAKYAQWIKYRDANCKPVEKMMGITIQSGKFSSNDNATKFECTNGMSYMMSDNAVANIVAGRGNLDHIPDPSKD